MKILCIIPARSGSQGIRNKNIKKIKDKTLIEITCGVAKKSKIFLNCKSFFSKLFIFF
jgi:CMP-N-acetylneuraminic acid synthetase|tara:strand:+ start:853 stop:1026 length:174 start_codon:yes stop_codon:yes gene_type:complete